MNFVKVTAAILFHDGKLLIARRKSSDIPGDLWEFPGGIIEPGESPEACLKREIREEFTIDISVHEQFAVSKYDYDHMSIELMAYRVTWNNGNFALNSHSEIAWVTINDLEKYVFAPADIPIVEKISAEGVA